MKRTALTALVAFCACGSPIAVPTPTPEPITPSLAPGGAGASVSAQRQPADGDPGAPVVTTGTSVGPLEAPIATLGPIPEPTADALDPYGLAPASSALAGDAGAADDPQTNALRELALVALREKLAAEGKLTPALEQSIDAAIAKLADALLASTERGVLPDFALVVAGEALGRPEWTDEGFDRLEHDLDDDDHADPRCPVVVKDIRRGMTAWAEAHCAPLAVLLARHPGTKQHVLRVCRGEHEHERDHDDDDD